VTGRAVLDAGAFDTALILEAQSGASDGLGGRIESWTSVATVFAKVETLSAARFPAAERDLAKINHAITIRHRAGISAGMRFAKGARRFRILSVRDLDETGRFLECMTEELP
jgi:SPP1 family predicted phage head-tail adaptor